MDVPERTEPAAGLAWYRRRRPLRSLGARSRTGRQPLLVALVGMVTLAGVVASCSNGDQSAGGPRSTIGTEQQEPEATGPFEIAPYSDLPAGKGLAWADQVQTDKANLPLPPDELGSYGLGDYESETVNIVGGERLTRPPAPCACEPREVWFTGASAAFGSGQRDLHTISSELVGVADRNGIPLRVRNLAVPGHTLWQEHAAILARLAQGDRPDLIVFYDGFNDVSYSFTEGVLGDPDFTEPIVDRAGRDPTKILDLGRAGIDDATEHLGGTRGLGQAAGRRYARLQELVVSNLEALDIPVLFVYQPDALTSPVQREAGVRAPLAGHDGVEAMEGALITVLDAAEAELPEEALDLRHLYDTLAVPVFFDPVHTNEHGAALAATAIWPELRAKLEPA